MSMSPHLAQSLAVLSAVILVSCCAVVMMPKGGDGPGDEPVKPVPAEPELVEFTFTESTLNYSAHTTQVYYSDDYFTHAGSTYDPHLATVSCALAMSTGSDGDSRPWEFVEDFLEKLGFSDIRHNSDYEVECTTDTIGVIIGTKDLDGTTLVCVVVRGIGYTREWSSNFDLGSEGDHHGFDIASDKVLSFIRTYSEEAEITDGAKMWITGYSRGGAVTNAVAGKICTAMKSGITQEVAGFSIASDGMYAYGVEVPCTVLPELHEDIHGPAYSGIWNIVNDADPVPDLVMAGYGLERYGTDVHLPDPSDEDYLSKKTAMLLYYNAMPDRTAIGAYLVDRFESAGGGTWTTQDTFLSDFNKEFASYIGDRSVYMEKIEPGIRTLIDQGLNISDPEKVFSTIQEEAADNKLAFGVAAYRLYNGEIAKALEILHPYLVKAVVSGGADEEAAEKLVTTVESMVAVFQTFIKDNWGMAYTLVNNVEGIVKAHGTELTLSWLKSLDSYYSATV